MSKEWVELLVRVGLQVADWVRDILKEKKGKMKDDRQGTYDKNRQV
jgi:hypothetical protein